MEQRKFHLCKTTLITHAAYLPFCRYRSNVRLTLSNYRVSRAIMLSGVLNVGKLEAVLTELSNKVVRLSTGLRGRHPHLTILLRSLD